MERTETRLIRDWPAKRPRFHIHFTPTLASWLNLVERWFALLTQTPTPALRPSLDKELENALSAFIQHHNRDPKRLVCHRTRDQILDPVARL